jgi:hypothetical protein
VIAKEVFKSFWAIYDNASAPNGLVYKYGWEQIPQNWYKIPADYTLVSLNLDLLALFAVQPSLMSIGGNTGTVNSFTGVDFDNLPGGITNAARLLEGNNLMCFALEVVKVFAPNSLSSLFATLATPIEMLSNTLAAPLLNLTCPAYADVADGGTELWNNLLAQYPGAAKAKSAL